MNTLIRELCSHTEKKSSQAQILSLPQEKIRKTSAEWDGKWYLVMSKLIKERTVRKTIMKKRRKKKKKTIIRIKKITMKLKIRRMKMKIKMKKKKQTIMMIRNRKMKTMMNKKERTQLVETMEKTRMKRISRRPKKSLKKLLTRRK